MKFLVAMRLLGQERKLFHVEATKKGDFYIHLRYANPPLGLPRLDRHMTKHKSGQRHFTIRESGKRHPTSETITQLQPTSNFRGVEQLLDSAVLLGQFSTLTPLGNRGGRSLLLDADSAGFRDDIFFVRVFLVEPHKENEIPTPTNVGPRVYHVEKSVIPWIYVEAFQEKAVPG